MKKLRVLFVVLAILGLAVLSLPISANENDVATISLNPSADNFVVDSEFEVAVILDSGEQAINVIDVIVYFPEDLIEVVGSPTRDGLLPLWQFNFSNEKGEINIVGGERQGGVKASNSEITRIKFRVKKEGKAILKVSSKNSSVIVADGLGTKSPIKAGEAYYSLITKPVVSETLEIPKTEVPLPSDQVPAEELKATILNQDNMENILFSIRTNIAGLLIAFVAIIYNTSKKRIEIKTGDGK